MFQDGTKIFVKTDTFELKRTINKNRADLRIVKIFAAQLGQQSKGINSFFHRICSAIQESSPEGIKFGAMRSFEREFQHCQIEYAGGMGWGDKIWPLL